MSPSRQVDAAPISSALSSSFAASFATSAPLPVPLRPDTSELLAFLGQSGLGCALWDAKQQLMMANAPWLQWLGVRAHEPLGQPLQSLIPADLWHLHAPHIAAATQGMHQEYEVQRPDELGMLQHLRVQLRPGDGDAMGSRCLFMLVQDVSREHARSEVITRQRQQLQTLHQQLRSSQHAAGEMDKLRTLLDWRTAMLAEHNEMLQLLSHEIRQPLNNASAAMQATLKAIDDLHLPDATPASKALLRAEHVLQQVIGTLDNTLAAGTILAVGGKAGASSETDLPTLIKLVLHDIAADLRPRIEVQWLTQPRTVQLHPALMRLTIRNLLNNALAYAPQDSQVQLRISESDEPLALILEVADQGPGIPAELLPRLFDKGTRGNDGRHRTGAGLGLFIVRSVLELHQGTVQALPNAPHGTIMRLLIPQGLAE